METFLPGSQNVWGPLHHVTAFLISIFSQRSVPRRAVLSTAIDSDLDLASFFLLCLLSSAKFEAHS